MPMKHIMQVLPKFGDRPKQEILRRQETRFALREYEFLFWYKNSVLSWYELLIWKINTHLVNGTHLSYYINSLLYQRLLNLAQEDGQRIMTQENSILKNCSSGTPIEFLFARIRPFPVSIQRRLMLFCGSTIEYYCTNKWKVKFYQFGLRKKQKLLGLKNAVLDEHLVTFTRLFF